MTKKIFFRADGNSEIGYGHVVRSLALANMLKDHFDCVFVTRFLNDFLEKEILKSCNRIVKLDENEHFEEFKNLITEDDIVVLDNYFYKTEHQKAIKQEKCKLVCIDDLAEHHFVADLVINHIDISPYKKYSREKYTKLALGLNYALLRATFFTNKAEKRVVKNDVLIAFGGVDPNNLTYKHLCFLLSITPNYKITVIINNKNKKYSDIVKLTKKNKMLQVYSNLSETEVKEQMLSCRIAILPTSTMCIEALSLGVNVLAGYYVDNQKYAYKYLNDNNYIIGLGDMKKITEYKLLEAINSNFEKKMNRAELSGMMYMSKKNHLSNFKSFLK